MITIIPSAALDKATLQSLVQEFVSRDGTDYGEVELSLEQKTETVLAQILAGTVVIVFDDESQSVNLYEKNNMPKEPPSSEY